MSTNDLLAFGPVLSRYRIASGLTQEELAERADLSVRGISDLERGVNKSPRAHTVRRLADALQLSADDRALFEAAARAAGKDSLPAVEDPRGDFLGALPEGALIGRDDVMARLRAILDAVREGVGQVALLSGETGAGKTRLAQEVMVEARAREMVVLVGRCYQAERGHAYYPILDALRHSPAAVGSAMRGEVQRAWKRVREAIGRVTEDNPAAMNTIQEQQIFGAATGLLLSMARSAPVVLLFDDLQWADAESLKLLLHVARAGRAAHILILATFREGRLTEEHPDLARMLQILSRERLAEHLTVRRLSLEETTSLVAAAMGGATVSDDFASFVYRRTKGIPRLITRMVRSLGGRLELQGEIGAGSMGRVFRAHDRAGDRVVAAKLVLARSEIELDALLRFQQEGAVLARLDHPNIVTIHDTFAEEHASCIVMEFLSGESLGQVLRDGPLPLARAKSLVMQVIAAVGYAHGQGIVHRDIKPDNVMVLEGDRAKVTDFGIARILQPDTSLQTMATTGMRMGTPLYMAPEQIEGKKIDGRTDIYALGAMLYHLVTGRSPFEGTDALAVAVKHLQEEPVPPSRVNPDVPPEWDAVILKALAKEPKERFQSAGEMAQAIESLPVQGGLRGVAHSPNRRKWAVLGGTSSILVAAAVAAAVLIGTHVTSGHAQSALTGKLNAYLNSLAGRHLINGTVLVAHDGKIVLSRGFGLADRKDQVANQPSTKYQGFGFNTNIVAALKLEEEGKIHDGDRICRYLPDCPANWRPITVHQVLAGRSGLFAINWGNLEGTPAQSLNMCHGPLQPPPSGATDYENCDVIVLGTIIEKVTGEPWGTALQHLIFGPAGMRNSGRLTDSLRPPARGDDYNGSISGDRFYYDPYFTLYAPAPDDLAYDQALFGGKLLSSADVRTLLAPRDLQPDPGIADARQAYKWKVGHIAGQPVVYTTTNASNAAGTDLWFPRDRSAVIVLSNVLQDDPEPVAIDLSKLLYGRRVIFPVLQTHVPAVSPARAVVATIDAQTLADAPAFMNHALWLPNDNIHTVTRVSDRSEAVAGITPLTPNLVGDPGDVSSVASDGSQLWVSYALHGPNGPGVVARLNPITGKVMERIPVPGAIYQLAVAHGIVWGTSLATDDVIRIDPRTRRATQVGRKFGSPVELVIGAGSVWVSSHVQHTASGSLRRIDLRTRRVVAMLHVGSDPESVAFGFGSLWLVNGTGGYISRIDPRTNKVLAQIALGTDEENTYFSLHSVVAGYDAVWVVVHRDRTLVRIDPATDHVTSRLTLPVPPNVSNVDAWDLAVGDGSVWIHAEPHLLYRIDPKVMAAA